MKMRTIELFCDMEKCRGKKWQLARCTVIIWHTYSILLWEMSSLLTKNPRKQHFVFSSVSCGLCIWYCICINISMEVKNKRDFSFWCYGQFLFIIFNINTKLRINWNISYSTNCSNYHYHITIVTTHWSCGNTTNHSYHCDNITVIPWQHYKSELP
jgi:hypothetical protein